MTSNSAVLTPLPEVVELNPRRFTSQPTETDLVSFVPMRAVGEESGLLDGSEVRSWSEVKKGYTAFQDGDVIVAKITPCMENGKFALASALHGGRAAGSTEFHVLRAKPALLPKYLLHFVFSPAVRRAAKMNMKGAAGQLRVPIQFFEGLHIPVPPLDVQRETVAYLDEQLSRLDASVAALHRVQANLKRYRASVLKSACEGRLVPTEAELARQEGRDFETGAQLLQGILAERRARSSASKYREPAAPAFPELPEVPAGWHWATMPQLGELNRGKSKHRPRDDERLYGGPYPFVQTGDVRHADGVLSRHTQTYSELGLQQSRLWPSGTLCITIAANIAETARLSYPACFPDSIVGFVCESGEVMTSWVQMFLATAKQNLEKFAPGTAQKNINLEVLQSVAIPLPPLAEQHRIVAEADRRLSLIRVAEAQVAANLARAQRLRQSILQAAFAAPA